METNVRILVDADRGCAGAQIMANIEQRFPVGRSYRYHAATELWSPKITPRTTALKVQGDDVENWKRGQLRARIAAEGLEWS